MRNAPGGASTSRRHTSPGFRVAVFASVMLAIAMLAVVAPLIFGRGGGIGPTTSGDPRVARPTAPAEWVFDRAANPGRTIVRNKSGRQLAVFTDGSRTVNVTGLTRTFREPKFTKDTVTLDVWVRLAPQVWHAGAQRDGWFNDWLSRELADTSLDALGVAFQYVYAAPDRYDANGVRYAGDAQFGPVSTTDPDGRAENNDFYDYLGISYSFSDGTTVQPQKDRYGDVDCSGFLRLVYGYRLGYPLRDSNTPGDGLPRRVFAISKYGSGTEVMRGHGVSDRDYAALQPGDLVFFNVDPTDGPQPDHSGIFLGVDDAGHYRFISSRTLANGPTMGDAKYSSILDGDGHFALALVNARRL